MGLQATTDRPVGLAGRPRQRGGGQLTRRKGLPPASSVAQGRRARARSIDTYSSVIPRTLATRRPVNPSSGSVTTASFRMPVSLAA